MTFFVVGLKFTNAVRRASILPTSSLLASRRPLITVITEPQRLLSAASQNSPGEQLHTHCVLRHIQPRLKLLSAPSPPHLGSPPFFKKLCQSWFLFDFFFPLFNLTPILEVRRHREPLVALRPHWGRGIRSHTEDAWTSCWRACSRWWDSELLLDVNGPHTPLWVRPLLLFVDR